MRNMQTIGAFMRLLDREGELMHFVLFYKIDVTNRYPVYTAACGAAVTVVLICTAHAWGWL